MAKDQLVLHPILSCLAQIWSSKFFMRFLSLLDVRNCCKLSLYPKMIDIVASYHCMKLKEKLIKQM